VTFGRSSLADGAKKRDRARNKGEKVERALKKRGLWGKKEKVHESIEEYTEREILNGAGRWRRNCIIPRLTIWFSQEKGKEKESPGISS